MTNLQTIIVDLNPRPDARDNTVFLKRGDKNSREVVVKLRDNGEPYQPPIGATIRYAMCKPDKTQVLADIPSYGVVGDTVRFTLSEQCMTVTGKFPAELWLIEDDQVLRTASFQIHVCPSAFSDDLPISSDEYESVSDALVKVDEIWSAYESGELGGGGTAAPENMVSILQHGAIPDNAAVDNTPAINTAISAAAASGKTIVYFPPGTYWISGTIDATGHNGMTYKGDNATIKLSGSVTNFHAMMLANGDNLTIDGLTFDQNVDGRPGIVMPLQNGTSAEIEARRAVCLKIDSTCKNVSVRNCSFTGCGKWLLLFKADGGRIENCKAHFVAPTNPPDAYMESGFLKYYDVSAIYASGQNITVSGATITATSPLLTPQTALELHATTCTIRDVTSEGYMSGCLVSGAYVTASEVRDILIENCTLRPSTAVGIGDIGARSQASGISLGGGSSSNGHKNIKGVIINHCRIDTPWYGITLHKGNGDMGTDEISITNTDIRYVGAANTAVRTDGLKAIDSAVNFRDYAPCALCMATTGVTASGITMSGCRVYDFPDVAVRANFATTNNNALVLFDRISIVGNEFVNCASSNPAVPQRSAVISLDNFSTADVSGNRFVYDLGTPPAPPMRLPICRYTSGIDCLRYTANSYYGYPDLSWAYVNNLDYPAGQFVFDPACVSVTDGITRIPRGNSFVSNGAAYCAVDGLALSDETITATVAEVTVEGVALLCTGSDAMRIGDKVKVLTRPAYIYNILPTEDATKCILVGQLCGDDTTAATAYPGSVAAGHPVTLITGVRTEAASSLRANATPDTAQRLPVATAATIGGVIAAAKTASQTEEVGIDAAGKLWTAPAAGATGDLAYDNASSGLTAQTVQGAIDELAAKIIIVANPESWAGVQSLIRAGWAQKVFAIGDQLECNHKTYGKLVWDVIGFDMDAMSIGAHSMTLQLHSLINETIVFDAAEAVYYAETGLNAGTYYITITGQDWYPADNGVSYQFTLTKPLPAGGQLVLSATFNAPLEGKSIVSYADNTTNTAIETAILTQGTGGVNLGTTDGTGAVNHIQCALFGSNDYTQSDMRLFLNGSASTEWTASNKFSRRPAWVTVSSRRFTEGLDEDFLEVVGETPKLFARNTVTGDGGLVTISDRFFLLSNSEVYGAGENEGDPYPYYADYSSLSAPGNGIDANRAKYNASAKADYWVLRSARRDNASSCNRVYPAGNITSGVASTTSGIVPACCIY